MIISSPRAVLKTKSKTRKKRYKDFSWTTVRGSSSQMKIWVHDKEDNSRKGSLKFTLEYNLDSFNGLIYTRDGSSVWDELGQRKIVRLIIRLRINTGKQTDHPSRRIIGITRVHRRITGDSSCERIIRLWVITDSSYSSSRIYTRRMIHLDEWSVWTDDPSLV